ncbi:sugar transferase [Marinovum sp.]|uniref:sugar transferase n=1 Tax=Marinovum sp. TaxID=2024839 RepID=UPI002B26A2BC|nr:sugar transferase [Marinovum sp.]
MLKRVFDIGFSLCLMPILVVTALCLMILNPFLNRGSLLYIQPRMGRDCRAFPAMKFRSMLPAASISRGANDPLETHRITALGRFLRKSRLDELPQLINVLRGDMSLIGPRPDYFHHARYYLRVIPGYRARHSVRPGISGLAQTQLGYAAGIEATAAKVRADLYYIQNAGFRLEAWIFWRTLVTVLGRHGA